MLPRLLLMSALLAGCGGADYDGLWSGSWATAQGDEGVMEVFVSGEDVNGRGRSAVTLEYFEVAGSLSGNDVEMSYRYPTAAYQASGHLREAGGHLMGSLMLSVGGQNFDMLSFDLSR